MKVWRYVRLYTSKAGITPLDFHFLMDWYDRGIPLGIVLKSIHKVSERHRQNSSKKVSRRRRPISNLWYFDNVVRRTFRLWNQLRAGDADQFQGRCQAEAHESPGRESQADENAFIDEEELLKSYAGDWQLDIRTRFFLRNLPECYRTAEVERRYRINYILTHRKRVKGTL